MLRNLRVGHARETRLAAGLTHGAPTRCCHRVLTDGPSGPGTAPAVFLGESNPALYHSRPASRIRTGRTQILRDSLYTSGFLGCNSSPSSLSSSPLNPLGPYRDAPLNTSRGRCPTFPSWPPRSLFSCPLSERLRSLRRSCLRVAATLPSPSLGLGCARDRVW